ncbi:MAG: cysteine desulfurase family protein [Patescibacteria group bacterium]
MIYLDYSATTPLDPRVLEAMMPYLTEEFGNASSIHQYGQRARRAIDDSRNTVMGLLGAFSPHEIIFTGSGTESCNTAIYGAAFSRQDRGKHIIVSAIEHPAVLEPARYLRDNFGFELTEIKPGPDGIVKPEDVEAALREDTVLVSLMYANNEVGTIQPIKKVAKLCRDRGILFHTDACQAPGFLNMDVDYLGVDLLSLNGSKIYGPKGVGLLYVREGVQITPLILGGGQEFRMRGGTENPALIVGFAKALELTMKDSKQEAARIGALRDSLLAELLKIPGITLNGSAEKRLENNINIHTPGLSGETLVMRLDIEGLATSSGSACSSGKTEASHVLLAMGQSPKEAGESLRLTLGRGTTQEEIETALSLLTKSLNRV